MVPSGPIWEVEGRLSATEERARNDARSTLEHELTERLSPDVPRDWKVPAPLIDSMIREIKVKPLVRDYGTVYAATLYVDFSPQKRAEIVEAFRHEQVVQRVVLIGAVFAFVLVVLAVVSGYIKTDEATKGYYTNTLRVAAASAVGAAGVAIYRMLI